MGGNAACVRFAEFEADFESLELFRNGTRVNIQEKPFQILRLLLRHPGQLVTRERICHELWPDVVVETEQCLNTAIRKLRLALGDSDAAPKFVDTVRHRGYRMICDVTPSPDCDRRDGWPSGHSIAVLPFQNLSGAGDEYFTDGITEEMTVQLGRNARALRVIASGSAMLYKHSGKTAGQIGSELKVDYIVSGSVMRTGNRVRVTAKLIRAHDQSCIWADSYTRYDSDIFFVQDEVTRQIARAILHTLPGTSGPKPYLITNPATYEKYLKAIYFADKWCEGGFQKAVQFLEEVIAEDPQFAPAYAALANLFGQLALEGAFPSSVVYERMKTLAAKALALSDEIDDAHSAMAWAHLLFEGDLAAARTSSLRALEINPSSAAAYHPYAHLLTAQQRHDEAISAIERARALDPLSPSRLVAVAWTYYFAGAFEAARRYAEQATEMEPSLHLAHATVGWVCQAVGDMEGALQSYRIAMRCFPDSRWTIANLAQGLAVAGECESARKLMTDLLDHRTGVKTSPYWLTLIYAGLNDVPKALDWLATAFEERCAWRLMAGVDPKLAVLHSEPRFHELVSALHPVFDTPKS